MASEDEINGLGSESKNEREKHKRTNTHHQPINYYEQTHRLYISALKLISMLETLDRS